MHIELISLIIGLIALWIGSNLTINGAINIATHYRISAGFIGLTILSIGTSIPEIAVSITGGIDNLYGMQTSGLVIGNIVGSAANLLTILLGTIGLFGALWIKPKYLTRDGIMLILSILVLAILGYDGHLSVLDGAILIVLYLAYIMDLSREEKLKTKLTGRRPELHLGLDLLRIIGGIFLVVYASDHVVKNGITLAQHWGVTQTFIGIFIIGLGTGLPELVVSIAAIRKKQTSMSVGNLIGSNICDLLFALGAGTIITGFTFPKNVLIYDLPALLIIALIVIYLFKRNYKITKKEALLLIGTYFVYLFLRLYLFG